MIGPATIATAPDVDRELERLLDVVARRAAVADLEAERLEDRALESDLAVHAVVDHHGEPREVCGHEPQATLTLPEVVLHG